MSKCVFHKNDLNSDLQDRLQDALEEIWEEQDEMNRKVMFINNLKEIGEGYEITSLPALADFIDDFVMEIAPELHDIIPSNVTTYLSGNSSNVDTIVEENPTKLDLEETEDNVKDFISINYGVATGVAQAMLTSFSDSLVDCVLVNRKTETVTVNKHQLNEELKAYQEGLLQDVVAYLKDMYSKLPQTKSKGTLERLSNLTMYKDGKYTGALELANEIGNMYLHHSHFTADDLNKKFELKQHKPSVKFINAYNALVILNHFDSLLTSKLGSFVKINQNYPVFSEEDRYYIEGTGSNNFTTWGQKDKDINMNEQVADINRLLIESTPIYAYGTDTPRAGLRLKVDTFTFIVAKLKHLAFNPESDRLVFDDVFFLSNPKLENLRPDIYNKSVKDIIDTLGVNPNNWHILFELLANSNVFNNNIFGRTFKGIERDTIWSIYKGITSNKNSLYSSMVPNHNYYEYITEVANTANFMPFMQYKLDEDTGSLKRVDLSENVLRRDLWTLKNNIASRLSRVSEYTFKLVSDKYDPVYNDGVFSINIPNTGISVKFKPNVDKNVAFTYYRNDKPIGMFNGEEDWYDLVPFFSDILGFDFSGELGEDYLSLKIVNGNVQFESAVQDLLQLSTSTYFGAYFSQVLAKDIKNLADYKALQESVFGDNKTSIIKDSRDVDIFNSKYIPILTDLATARALSTQSYASGLTKDGQGNSLSTTLTSTLGSIFNTQWALQNRKDNSATKDMSIIKDKFLISGTSVSREFNTLNANKKHVDFNPSEAFYAAFILNHLNAKVTNGTAAYMPSVISDKSQLIHELIELGSISDLGKVFSALSETELITLINKELGDCYSKIIDNILLDWSQFNSGVANLTPEVRSKYQIPDVVPIFNPLTNFSEVNSLYGNESRELLEKLQLAYQEQYGSGLELIDELYYSGGKSLRANRTLISLTNRFSPEYFASKGYNPEEVFGKLTNSDEFWASKRLELVTELLDQEVVIPIIDGYGKVIDSPEMKHLSKMDGWYRKGTGYLIFCKVTPVNGKPISINSWKDCSQLSYTKDGVTYYGNLPGFNFKDFVAITGAKVELHPEIAQFNASYYFFTNEFMLSTVGTVANHPAKKAANDTIDLVEEAARFNGQHKRNNSMTAAKQVYNKGQINGILPESTIAVIEDDTSAVYNLMGDYDERGVKHYDGAMFTSPDTVYLENNSLGGAAAGVDKKPYHHFYKERTASGGMIKTAGFGLTNGKMCKSLPLQNICRKLWSREWDKPRNVLIDYNGNPINYEDVYYKGTNGKFYMVNSISYNGDGTYSLIKSEVEPDGTIVRQLPIEFTPAIGGNPIITASGITLYPVNTNFGLYQMFGGVSTYSKDESGNLVRSESSVRNVVEAVNSVGDKLSDVVRFQNDVYQPLKEATINYLVTAGAIKQGAANVNRAHSYFDATPFLTMKVRNDDSGIQLDKEHEADDATISMMTQVVNALCARGYTSKKATKVYEAINTLTNVVLSDYLKGFDKYLESGDTDEFKDAISKVITKTILTSKEQDGSLMSAVMSDIRESILNSKLITFKDLESKVPFSSPSIFNKLSSAISSTLTNLAVRLKPNGTLAVINPSHRLWLLYGDRMYDSFNNPEEIQNLQKEYDSKPLTVGQIRLGRCYKILTENGPIVEFINTPKQYWNLASRLSPDNVIVEQIAPVDNAVQWDTKSGQYIPFDFKFGGRDLAAYNFTFTDGETIYNMWDLDIVKQIYSDSNSREVLLEKLQGVLNAISKGFMVSVNGKQFIPQNLEVQPFEVIMPKIYQTTFGLRNSDDLYTIKNSPNFFLSRMLSNWDDKVSDENFDIELKRLNGSHVYLVDKRFFKETSLREKPEIETRWEDNKLYRVDANGNKLHRLSDESDKIYIDGNGNEVIVTNNTQFYIDSFDYHTIRVSDSAAKSDNVEKIIQPILSSKSKKAVKFAKYIGKNVPTDIITYTNKVYRDSIEKLKTNPNAKIDDPVIDNLRESAMEIYTSFVKSLDVLAARIPAQSMQSFMAMRVAGFDDSGKNSAYVNTFQFWLQGSDLDIDAVSLLGYSFDKSGKYVGWSPFFNLSNTKTLADSELLPFPTNKELELVETDDKSLTNWAIDFVGSGKLFNFNGTEVVFLPEFDTDGNLNALAELRKFLEMVNTDGRLYIPKGSKLPFGTIKELIDSHNLYLNNDSRAEDMIKNFISTNMYNISKDPINIIQSMTSIDGIMGTLVEEARNSDISTRERDYTSGNVMSICTTFQNFQIGKKNMGVVASAKKVFDGLTQYYNNALNTGQTNNLLFNNTICGSNYRLLANCYTDQMVNDSEVREALSEVDQLVDAGLVLSALMNASVDNAKDPILSKINAGLDMMNLYTYGVTIGIPLKDLCRTMMSYTGKLLAKYMNGNSFTGSPKLSLNKAIQYLENGPDIESLDDDCIQMLKDLFGIDNTFVIGKVLSKRLENINSGNELVSKIRKYIKDMPYDPTKVNLYRFADQLSSYILEKHRVMQDKAINIRGIEFNPLESIKELSQGSSEMNRIRAIFNLNRELPNKLEDKFKTLDAFETIISDRLMSLDVDDNTLVSINGNYVSVKNVVSRINSVTDNGRISLRKFFYDPEYRETLISLYNGIKHTYNVLDAIWSVPHYRGYLQSFLMDIESETTLSAKFRMIRKYGPMVAKDSGFYSSVQKGDMYKKISSFCDTVIRNNWLRTRNINVPANVTIYNSLGDKFTTTESTPIILGTPWGNASFKMWMESTVIPELKETEPNRFIEALVPNKFSRTISRNAEVVYTLPINMIPRSVSEIDALSRFKREFNKLHGVPAYNGIPVIDLFFYYNLICFNNSSSQISLANIFEDIIKTKSSPLIESYYKYVSELDTNSDLIEDLDFTYDSLLRWCAPTGSTFVLKNRYVRSYNNDTMQYELWESKKTTENDKFDDGDFEDYYDPYLDADEGFGMSNIDFDKYSRVFDEDFKTPFDISEVSNVNKLRISADSILSLGGDSKIESITYKGHSYDRRFLLDRLQELGGSESDLDIPYVVKRVNGVSIKTVDTTLFSSIITQLLDNPC